jgi:hypothetical protein
MGKRREEKRREEKRREERFLAALGMTGGGSVWRGCTEEWVFAVE